MNISRTLPLSRPTSEPQMSSAPETPATSPASSKEAQTFDVLSLNIYALPKPLGKDIAQRAERIGESLAPYEIMGFQETFSGDSRYMAQGAETVGLSLESYQPKSRRLLTSGLTTFSEYKIVQQGFKPFKFASHADALAQKGVAFTRLELPNGAMLDVYNTHFQAMRDKADQAHEKLGLKIMAQLFPGYDMPRDDIRAHDAEILSKFIQENESGHATIVMGDFNTQENHPLYQELKDTLGVKDSYRELNPDAPGYTSDGKTNPYKSNPDKRKRVDYIFYKSGADTELKAMSSEVVFDKAVKGLFVSDHYGVQTRFQLSPKSP